MNTKAVKISSTSGSLSTLSSSSSSSSSSSGVVEVKERKRRPTSEWLKAFYSNVILTKEELEEMYDEIKFIGFDRLAIIAQLEEKIQDQKLAIEAVMVCSLRGPQAAQNIKLRNGKSLKQMGIPASGVQGTEAISCQRISAATADMAAFYFKKLDVPKRIPSHPLPAYLQFPAAGSIKMPQHLREMHIDFSRKFSELIGGVFNESIYSTMVANAYLDDSFSLFD